MQSKEPAFTLAGISVRTTNLGGQSQQDIGKLWAEFFQQDMQQKIVGRKSAEIVCAYTNYASDMRGPYTTVLGFFVDPDAVQEEDITTVHLPASSYLKFVSADARPQTVMQTWTKIWQTELPRAYQTDFDICRADGTVETWVSVTA